MVWAHYSAVPRNSIITTNTTASPRRLATVLSRVNAPARQQAPQQLRLPALLHLLRRAGTDTARPATEPRRGQDARPRAAAEPRADEGDAGRDRVRGRARRVARLHRVHLPQQADRHLPRGAVHAVRLVGAVWLVHGQPGGPGGAEVPDHPARYQEDHGHAGAVGGEELSEG